MAASLRTSNFAIADRINFLARGMFCVMLLAWAASFYPFDDLLDRQGTPWGADFSMFYAAGKVVGDGAAAQIYDQAEHQRQLHSLFPNLRPEFCLPYRYPPSIAWLISPLAKVPYPVAYLLFFGASLAIWILSLRTLRSLATGPASIAATRPESSRAVGNSISFGLAAWPIALETLIGGQASMFGLGIVVASLSLIRCKQPVVAGAVLALAIYKPNVLALFAVGLVFRYPRILLGVVPISLLLAIASCWICGWTTCAEYVDLLTHLSGKSWDVATPFWKIQGIEPWMALIVPERSRLMTAVLGLTLSVAAGVGYRFRKAPETMAFAEFVVVLLVINTLLNPYTPIYDLVLLAPAIVLGAQRLLFVKPAGSTEIGPVAIQIVVFAMFFGPHLSQAVARMIGIQLFPIALLLIVVWFVGPCWWPSRGQCAEAVDQRGEAIA